MKISSVPDCLTASTRASRLALSERATGNSGSRLMPARPRASMRVDPHRSGGLLNSTRAEGPILPLMNDRLQNSGGVSSRGFDGSYHLRCQMALRNASPVLAAGPANWNDTSWTGANWV